MAKIKIPPAVDIPPRKKRVKPSVAKVKKPTNSSINKKAWADGKAEAAKPVIRPMGRPREYSDADRARIIPEAFRRLECGDSLYKVMRDIPDAPDVATFRRWVYADSELTRLYAESRHRGYLTFAEDIQEIADNPNEGITTTITVGPDGTETKVTKADMLGHRTLQVATRKWLLSKMLPKIFGDKALTEPTSDEAVVNALNNIAKRLPV